MNTPPEPSGKEQRLLQHARREGLLVMFVWAVALFWTISSGYVLGYQTDPRQMAFVFGMPEWILWSVVLPWALCFLFSIWFCFSYMADDDLGEDRAGRQGHA
jgi:hypothetical protein